MDVATQEDFYELDENLYALLDANTEKRYEKIIGLVLVNEDEFQNWEPAIMDRGGSIKSVKTIENFVRVIPEEKLPEEPNMDLEI